MNLIQWRWTLVNGARRVIIISGMLLVIALLPVDIYAVDERDPLMPENIAQLRFLGQIALPERDIFRQIALSPDELRLALTNGDDTITLWDIAAGAEVATLRGHVGMVRSLVFSPDGSLLASGGDDFTVRLWDAVTGQPVTTLVGHDASVLDLAFSPDGQRMASAAGFSTVRIWDVPNRRVIGRLRVYRGDGAALAMSAVGVAHLGEDQVVQIGDHDGNRIGTLSGDFRNRPFTLAYNPAINRLAVGTTGGRIRLYSGIGSGGVGTLIGTRGRAVNGLAFTPDGALLISIEGGSDGRVYFWDVVSEVRLHTLTLDQPPIDLALGQTLLVLSDVTVAVTLWGVPVGLPTQTPTLTSSPRPTDTSVAPADLSCTPPPPPTATVSPSPRPIATETPTPLPTATPDRIIVGRVVTVNVERDDLLNVRLEPSIASGLLERLPDGARVTVIGGPHAADGYTWWQIRTASGIEGWAVEMADGVQTLIP